MNPDQFINLSGSPDAFSTSDPVYFEVETFGNDAPWTLTVTAPDGSVHSQSGSGNTRYTAPDPLQSGAYKGRVAYDDDSANASATVNVFLTQPSPTPYPTATPSTSPKPGTDPCPEGIRPGDPNLFSKIVDFLTSLGRDDFGIKSILDPGQFDNWGGLKQVFSEEYSKYSQIRIAYTIRINDKVHRLRQIQETIKQNGKDLTPEQKQELVAEKIQVQNDIRSIEADQRKNDQKLKTFDTWDRQINPTQPPCAETANNGGGQPSPEPPRDIGKSPKNLTSDQKAFVQAVENAERPGSVLDISGSARGKDLSRATNSTKDKKNMALLEGTVDGKNYNHYTRSTTDDRIDVSKY